jgi:NDP-mannose synthase
MKAVILAGGLGTRLRPYTTVLPKPLMPVGDKPILEILIRQLSSYGYSDINISVGYLASLIEAYCENGSRLGVSISYIREDTPLGTAGSLRLVKHEGKSFLVTNGDVLTDLDFGDLYDYHQIGGQILTVATYQKEVKIQLGVLALEGDQIIKYTEKPTLRHMVSMGVYCCSPEVLKFIPDKGHFDLPDLVRILIKNDLPVKSYQHKGYWLDIGNHDDYELAQNECDFLI